MGWKLAATAAIVTAVAALALAAPPSAERGSLRGVVEVSRPNSLPSGPVLVYIVGFSEPAPSAAGVIAQKGKRFVPDLLAITAGQSVQFPNGDPLLHNVFSPTADRTFDLGSFPKGDTRSRRFPQPGVIEIYCNIHPEMSATIVVAPNQKFAIAGADGQFEIAGLPIGTWQVFAYSRRAPKPARATVVITSNAVASTTLKLVEVDRDFSQHANKYGEKYRDGGSIYLPD
jgi:plastocyanin